MFKTLILIMVIEMSQNKLEQALIIFRHGARYHLSDFAKPGDTQPFWGELSGVGMKQLQSFGEILRKEYIEEENFLSSKFTQKQIQAYSTTLNRAIQSAECFMYGLYSQNGPKLESSQKKYHLPPYSNKTDERQAYYALPNGHQPVPIKQNFKVILQPPQVCSNYEILKKNTIRNNELEIEKMQEKYEPFLKKMSSLFHMPDLSVRNIASLYDLVMGNQYLNWPLPEELTSEDIQNIGHLAAWMYNLKSEGQIIKLISTRTIERIFTRFDGRIKGSSSPKFTILSVHNMQLTPLVLALNLTSRECIEQNWISKDTVTVCEGYPAFASSLLFQLHSEEENYFVKVKYDGRYMPLCQKTQTKCFYGQWKKRMSQNIQEDLDQLCGNQPFQDFFEEFTASS